MTDLHDFLTDVRAAQTRAVTPLLTHQWTLADLTAYRAPDGRVLMQVGLGPLTFHTSEGHTVGDALLALYAHLGLTPPPLTLPPYRPPPGTLVRVTDQGGVYLARALFTGGRRSRPTQGDTPPHALSFLLHTLKETSA